MLRLNRMSPKRTRILVGPTLSLLVSLPLWAIVTASIGEHYYGCTGELGARIYCDVGWASGLFYVSSMVSIIGMLYVVFWPVALLLPAYGVYALIRLHEEPEHDVLWWWNVVLSILALLIPTLVFSLHFI